VQSSFINTTRALQGPG